MPYNLQKTVVVGGPRIAVVHLVLTSDGSGELVNAPFIDLRNDLNAMVRPSESKITQIWWSTSYFDFTLLKDDLIDPVIWVCSVNGQYADFRSFGGIKVPQTIDGNGDILITTSGFAPNGSIGSIIIELKKN